MENYCKVCGAEVVVDLNKSGPKRKEFCSRVCYKKWYNSRPDVKARKAAVRREYENSPKGRDKVRAYNERNKNCPHFQLSKRLYHISKTFGLTESEFVSMMDYQRGCCDICGDSLESLNIDHCHETGKVRGLLCNNCNCALGLFKDSEKILLSAASYLTK